MPAAGGPEVDLGQVDRTVSYPLPGPHLVWTPDGRSVIGHRNEVRGNLYGSPKQGLMRFPVDGSHPVWLIPPFRTTAPDLQGSCCPAFSPDGRALAFFSLNVGFMELFVQKLSANLELQGSPAQVTQLRALSSGPAWIPDGRSLLFHSGNMDSSFLWRVAAGGGGEAVRLTALGPNASYAAVSRTGQLIFSRGYRNADLWSASLTGDTAPRRLTSSVLEELSAHFSPDGRRIVFTSARSGHMEVWMANADGSNPTRLTSMKAPVTGWPTWSPDGSRILFDSNPTGDYQIYTVSAAGGEPTQLTTSKTSNAVAGWSHDGKSIYFVSQRSGEGQLWTMPAAPETATSPRQITKQGASLARLSSDGSHYVYVRGGNVGPLCRVPVDGVEERCRPEKISRFKFVPVNDGVYYIGQSEGEAAPNQKLFFYSWSSGQDRLVRTLPFTGTNAGLDIAPDGRTLLFSAWEQSEGDLMTVQLP